MNIEKYKNTGFTHNEEEYFILLLKIYWFLKGLNTYNNEFPIDQLIEMIEEFI